MNGPLRVHLCDLGQLLQVPGLLALPALAVGAAWGEWFALPGLAVMGAVSFALGWGLHRSCRFAPDDEVPAVLSSHALAVVALAWLLIAAFAAVPFWAVTLADTPLSATTVAFADPVNALFESMSGLTSAGLSVAADASELPRTLQFWRSWLEWTGGIGLVLVALTVIETTQDAYDLYGTELNIDTLQENTDHTVRWIWVIYTAYTVLGAGLFWALGMPAWEALNHAMTGLATGGFSVTSDSFVGYGADLKLAAMLVMILGGVSFLTHYRLLVARAWGKAERDIQTRWLFGLLVGGTVALLLVNRRAEGEWLVVDSLFQWTSALMTCGFNSVEVEAWSGAAVFLLVAAMFVGSAAGSTGGGIKIRRLALLVRAVGWRLRGIDDALDEPFEFGGSEWDASEAGTELRKASVVLFLFFAALALGTLALLVLVGDAFSVRDLLFEAASALGAVGLSVGVTGPDLAPAARLVLIGLMWAGRLEILAVLVLALTFMPRKRR